MTIAITPIRSRFSRPDEATLLTFHNALYTLALAIASGFIGAYLLRDGFSLPVVLLMYALLYAVRYGFRIAIMPLVRLLGFRRSVMAGMGIIGLQFLPLAWAEDPRWLVGWVLCLSLGEAIYWPSYHASVAVAGDVEKRGRQLGLRSALNAIATIFGPLVGGFMISRLGPSAAFIAGGVTALLAAAPLLFCREFDAGDVPSFRETLRGADRLGMIVFFTDGWMCAGWLTMWPLVYFVQLGSHYEAFGIANAAAGLVGFLVSLLGGRWIDRRRNDTTQLLSVCGALAISILLRAGADWWPMGGTIANLTGSAMLSAYVPLIMSAMYDRAKRSTNAFQFHLAIEGAWDTGSVLGFLTGAAIAWFAGTHISLIILPALLGVCAFAWCMRRDRSHVAITMPIDHVLDVSQSSI